MKYWLDTEFIEDGKTIDLISIGIVAEDGREYYAVNADCHFEMASDWVWKNVLHPIGIYQPLKFINPSDPSTSPQTKETLLRAKTRKYIKEDLLLFLAGGQIDPIEDQTVSAESYKEVCVWGYYADYDWVVFCQLFGTMMDLPKGFPMYCRDIKQWCDSLGNPKLPEQGKGEHNALADAKWNKTAWEFLRKYEENCVVERT